MTFCCRPLKLWIWHSILNLPKRPQGQRNHNGQVLAPPPLRHGAPAHGPAARPVHRHVVASNTCGSMGKNRKNGWGVGVANVRDAPWLRDMPGMELVYVLRCEVGLPVGTNADTAAAAATRVAMARSRGAVYFRAYSCLFFCQRNKGIENWIYVPDFWVVNFCSAAEHV